MIDLNVYYCIVFKHVVTSAKLVSQNQKKSVKGYIKLGYFGD